MNRTLIAAATTAGVLVLPACGPAPVDPGRPVSTTFPAPTGELTIANEFGRVEVKEAATHEVKVVRTVTAIGKTPTAPDWSLTGNTLTLRSACGRGYVGVCEPTFRVTVPKGMKTQVVEKN
ncbi:hypothetical protein GCM10027418_28790 [Mariniluteicoccus endophyticus]